MCISFYSYPTVVALTSTLQPSLPIGELTLIFTQILFRHGDRSPLFTYPNDTWKDHWNGFGQLTTVGMQQHYELGQYFRQRYENFLNASYKASEIHVRSTSFDRTLMSAYCNLAGLYPPTGNQVWNQNILWQPIPVHTMPIEEDYVLYHRMPCPKYKSLLAEYEEKRLQSMTEAEKEHTDKLLEFGRTKAGMPMNPVNIQDFADVFVVQKINNLTRPDWADSFVQEATDWVALMSSPNTDELVNLKKEVDRLAGGPLVDLLMNNIRSKIAGNLTEKMLMYSTHDTTLLRLLDALQIKRNAGVPEYRSTIMVELYLDTKNQSFVQISYRNDTSQAPYELTVGNCPFSCPWEELESFTADKIVVDYVKECRVDL